MSLIEAVTTAGQFDALAPAWADLLAASPRRSVFLSHEWLASWWITHPSPGSALCVLVARDDDGISALAPLVRVRRRYLGVPVSMIEFLSMSMFADHPAAVTGSLDWIVNQDPARAIGAFLDHLSSVRDSWHALRLHPVPSDSPSIPILREECSRRGWTLVRRHVLDNAVITCGGDWDRFYGSLTGDFRRTLRRRAEYLATLGAPAYTRIDAMETGAMFRRLLDIERRSWKWEKGVSLNSAAFGDFFAEFARRAAARGWLRAWVLSLSGEDIAYELCVACDGELHCLKKSYDARYAEAFPGGLLERHIYEEAFREGLTRIHTLWGDAAHKLLWRSALEPHEELLVFHGSARSRSARALIVGARAPRMHREAAEAGKRLMRRMGFHPRFSELTRMDQT
jgi:CelD/BcsL family acetyltransferase involved in cellulose biosynthesis